MGGSFEFSDVATDIKYLEAGSRGCQNRPAAAVGAAPNGSSFDGKSHGPFEAWPRPPCMKYQASN